MKGITTEYKGNQTKLTAKVIINGKERTHTSTKMTGNEYIRMCEKNGWKVVKLHIQFPESKKVKQEHVPAAWTR